VEVLPPHDRVRGVRLPAQALEPSDPGARVVGENGLESRVERDGAPLVGERAREVAVVFRDDSGHDRRACEDRRQLRGKSDPATSNLANSSGSRRSSA
jgi:hypothetical protein